MNHLIYPKLEWGNPQHIEMVRYYDLRMRGEMPVLLNASVDYCFAKCEPNRHGTWLFTRTGGRQTKNQHCIARCPGCNNDVELVWSIEHQDEDWHKCNICGIDFELRETLVPEFPYKKYEVFVTQEGNV